MKIYIKYLLKDLLKYFILILFILTTTIWITRAIRYIYYITEYGINVKKFLTIVFSVLPNLLTLTIPITTFIATIFSYNRAIKSNELIILETSGIKKSHLLIPIILASTIISILSYTITLHFLQLGNIKFEETVQSAKNDAIKVLLNNTNFNSFQNITIYAKHKNNNDLTSLFLYIKSEDNNNSNKIIYAKTGHIVNSSIVLQKGMVQEFTNDDNDLKTIYFDRYVINMLEYYKNDEKKGFDFELESLGKIWKHRENLLIKAEIAHRLLTPLLSITLSVLASMMLINMNFSRGENNKSIAKIYTICLLNFAIYLFSIKSYKKNEIYLYLSIISLMTPLFYIIIKIIINKIKYRHV